MALVHLESLEKVYTQGQIEVPALRGIDLQVEEGEFTTIFGPSGSGKTTLLNMIGCLDRPTAGRVFLDGRDITGLNKRELAMIRRHHVGFIFQSYNLIPVLTAYENVEFTLRIIDDKSAGEIRRAVLDMLEAVGLTGLEGRKPGELSGGQKQRVAIARALVKRPRLVLADEPTANLDSQTSTDVLEIMLQMNKQMNTTFIFSTHDPRVMKYARRMVEIRDGQVARDERRGAEGVSVETGLEESNPT